MERWLRHLFAVRIGRAGLLEHRHFMSAEGYSVRKAATPGDPKIGCGVVISRCTKSTNDGCYLRPISLTKVGQDDKTEKPVWTKGSGGDTMAARRGFLRAPRIRRITHEKRRDVYRKK